MHNSLFAIHSKTVGILLAVVGMILIAGNYYTEAQNESLNILFGAMVLIGMGVFIVGLLSTAVSLSKRKTSMHHDDGTIAAAALIRCMIAICIADEHLDEREIGMIAKIYKQLMNTEIDKETIINAAEEMQNSETDISNELAMINDTLYEDLRMKILKASLYILVADNDVDPREEAVLEDIRIGLGYSEGKMNKAKEKFLKERNLQSND